VPPAPATSRESDWHDAIDEELRRRAQHDLLEHGVGQQAKVLHAWLQQQAIEAPGTVKTVERYIRLPFRKLGGVLALPGRRPR
jgi:hypothetical protein